MTAIQGPGRSTNFSHKEAGQVQFTETQLAFSFRLMETTTLTGAVEELLATIGSLLYYDTGSVMLLEPKNPDVGHFAAVSGYTDPAEALLRVIKIQDFPLLDQMRRQRKEIYFPEMRDNAQWQPGHQPDREEVRSILLTPLLYDQQSEMIGCLTLKSFTPNAFSAEERNNITLLCNQTASALRNIRLLEETSLRLKEVTILADLSRRLNRTVELEEVFQLVLNQVISILGRSTEKKSLKGAIILRHQPGDILRMVARHNISDRFCSFFNSQPYSAQDFGFAERVLQGEWVEVDDPREILAVVTWPDLAVNFNELLNIPLKIGEEVIGAIITNGTVAEQTTRRLIDAIADLAGAAIHRARLLTQARARAVELIEAHEALNEMDKMRDEFIQNLTHDLRAPLTFIRGYADLMVDEAMGEINEEQREALAVIQERTDAATRMVDELLRVKEVESQPLEEEPVDLVTVCEFAVRSALMSARKAGLDISLTKLSESAVVRGDVDRLNQVFDNLLSNAIKYTPEGGHVWVQIGQQWPKVIVSVSDTGIGIPFEELGNIWNRYYRVRNLSTEYSGTGLGLPNVRRIVEAHNGQIWVQSSNEGTTFTFELPLYR
jgi:signal transduction histidine kinase